MMNLLDKSTYSLLFTEETELNPYTGQIGSTNAVVGNANGTRKNLRNFGSDSQSIKNTMNKSTKPHTILNMKTTLVNGKYSNCDKCDSSSDIESEEKRPLVMSEVMHGVSPLKASNVDFTSTTTTTVSNLSLQPNTYNFGITTGGGSQLQDCYNIEYFTSNGSIVETRKAPLVDVELFGNSGTVGPSPIGNVTQTMTQSGNWGPDSISSNLSSGTTVNNSYSEGQKILPSTYFIRDYADIFGNIAHYDETDDVAKLPITSEESKMFLIGLSSNNENDEEEDDALMENEDQASSNSPFQSATEEMGGEGDADRGDQDPLLIRPPPKQNVFHQFIRSAKSSKNMRMTKQRRHSYRDNPNSRDPSPCSSAIIKESRPPEGHDEDSAGSSSTRTLAQDNMRNGGSRCSIGIFLAAISCVFFATSALIVKISNLHPMELLAVRGLVQGILVSPIVISTGNSFLGPAGSRSLLLARAVLGAVALVMGFASIHLIPLADAATVIFTSPVFVSIFACLCLGEVCCWFDVSMIALTLLGVLLVSKPSFSFISNGTWTGIIGTICGLIAAMLTALAFIVLRQLKVHYSVTVFWFSTILSTFGAILTIALDGFTMPRTWPNILECVGIGFCGFMGQILLTKALQSENALPIAVTRTFDIVLAFFYQITLLHDTPDWYSYLGSVLVVSCVLLTAFRRWYKESTKNLYTRVHKIPDDDNPDENQQESTPSSPMTSHHHHTHPHHRTDEQGSFS